MDSGQSKRCLYCSKDYQQQPDSVLYPEAFCSAECERSFAEHVMRYYGGTRVLATMTPGNA